MGVVLSPEIVSEGKYPRPGDHETAAKAVIERFMEPALSRWWPRYGCHYIVHGSVPEGTSNITSDLDLCVVAGDFRVAHMVTELGYELSLAREIALTDQNVHLEAKVIPLNSLGCGRERDPLFLYYLSSLITDPESDFVQKWTSGDFKPDLLAPYDKRPRSAAMASGLADYLAAKLQGLSQPSTDLRDAEKHIQRAHELPGRAIAKLGQFFDILSGQDTTTAKVVVATEQMLLAGMEEYADAPEEVAVRKVIKSGSSSIHPNLRRIKDVGVRKHIITLARRKHDGIALLTAVSQEEKGAFARYKTWYERSMKDSAARGVIVAEALLELVRKYPME